MKKLTENEFKEGIKKGITVVDFFADWCGPCKMLAPVFEDTSKEYEDVNFAKVDVENERGLASEYNVMGIPTVIFFKDGEEIERITGFSPKEVLKQKIESIM